MKSLSRRNWGLVGKIPRATGYFLIARSFRTSMGEILKKLPVPFPTPPPVSGIYLDSVYVPDVYVACAHSFFFRRCDRGVFHSRKGQKASRLGICGKDSETEAGYDPLRRAVERREVPTWKQVGSTPWRPGGLAQHTSKRSMACVFRLDRPRRPEDQGRGVPLNWRLK